MNLAVMVPLTEIWHLHCTCACTYYIYIYQCLSLACTIYSNRQQHIQCLCVCVCVCVWACVCVCIATYTLCVCAPAHNGKWCKDCHTRWSHPLGPPGHYAKAYWASDFWHFSWSGTRSSQKHQQYPWCGVGTKSPTQPNLGPYFRTV